MTCGARVIGHVSKVIARQDRDAHRLEVVARDDVAQRLFLLLGALRPAFEREAAYWQTVNVERHVARQGDGLNGRNAMQAVEQVDGELPRRVFRDNAAGQVVGRNAAGLPS